MEEKEKRIKNWVLKNGYPFEMKVANLFQKKGFKITQSIHYKDFDTKKYRELALKYHPDKGNNNIEYQKMINNIKDIFK